MSVTQLFFFMLLVHTLADFSLQTRQQAAGKSVGNNPLNTDLLRHVGVYSLVWFIAMFALPLNDVLTTLTEVIIFCILAIGLPHYITDYITSRIGSKFFGSGDTHNGFLVVGFDQLLHLLTLWVFLIRVVEINSLY